ncbi:hypothetical protein B0180_10015 [Moraxella canis]|uniref:Uncharacterized protein n=2 Tax=Moraxella canis TaxID=90239 RepID=A0A1S9ZF21_9GAMM|nr:hypothetical protein B0180_10015 [Moraxella canis]
MIAIYGDDFGRKTTHSPETRSQAPQRENTSHDYDFGRKTTHSPETRSQAPQRENTSHDYDFGM